MTHKRQDLHEISARTLDHYDRRAEDFWKGTRDQDVSQNIAALLRYLESEPPLAILDLGCGPGRDLKAFADLGHVAVGLEGSARERVAQAVNAPGSRHRVTPPRGRVMRDAECTVFLQWALPRLDRHWPGYRKVRRIVCKRLGRRQRALGLAGLDAYRARLLEHEEEWAELDALCGIPISCFYRDRGVFDALEREVLPALGEAAAPRGSLEAWSAGCACGEEPYTLAMLWAVRLQARHSRLALRIVATDVDEQLLARAREGVFSPSSLKELPDDLRAAGFERVDGRWRVREPLRRVEFLRQDLRETMPRGPFDLILCRNVLLTYYAPPLRERLIERVVERLRPGGALVVGIHETMPAAALGVEAWPGARAVYRRTLAA